ncbi:Fc.00g025270.m01.CDS01 [Cosmosporella sp. VM-42]
MRWPRLYLALALIACHTPALGDSSPSFAPIPPSAVGPAVSNTTGFRTEQLGKGAYLITDGTYQSLFLIASESVIVVDAPPTLGHNLLRGIKSITNLPVSHIVYSHAHADHIGAAYIIYGSSPNITVVAHRETWEQLSEVNGKINGTTNALVDARPLPNKTFIGDLTLQICNQTLELSYKGPNHQPGNIFIYAPKQKIVMLVDVVYPGWVPFNALGESQNIPGYLKAHDQILEYDFDYYLGGHLNRFGTRQDVSIAKQYIDDLASNCLQAIQLSAMPPNETNPLSAQTALTAIGQANPGNSWAVFDYYLNNLLADWCTNKTVETWLGKLAGADVYTKSNAQIMVESLRIDFGWLGPFGVVNQQ